MAFLCAVHGDAEQEVVFMEKTAPVIVQQQAVGLQGVLNPDPVSIVFFLIENRLFKKIQPAQRGLPALKGIGRAAVGAQQRAADDVFQRFFGHEAVGGLAALFRFIAVKAVFTGHVAHPGGGLEHESDGRHEASPFRADVPVFRGQVGERIFPYFATKLTMTRKHQFYDFLIFQCDSLPVESLRILHR